MAAFVPRPQWEKRERRKNGKQIRLKTFLAAQFLVSSPLEKEINQLEFLLFFTIPLFLLGFLSMTWPVSGESVSCYFLLFFFLFCFVLFHECTSTWGSRRRCACPSSIRPSLRSSILWSVHPPVFDQKIRLLAKKRICEKMLITQKQWKCEPKCGWSKKEPFR